MRFLADMGISPNTVAMLRGLGYDALHLHEQGLDRLQDPLILQKARDEGRILLTHDLDFGELIAASGARLPTIVVFVYATWARRGLIAIWMVSSISTGKHSSKELSLA
jgi:predicted nuclease of predicted toxin-antitoxin system